MESRVACAKLEALPTASRAKIESFGRGLGFFFRVLFSLYMSCWVDAVIYDKQQYRNQIKSKIHHGVYQTWIGATLGICALVKNKGIYLYQDLCSQV